MKICIDGNPIGTKGFRTGAYRYIISLLDVLKEVDKYNEYIVFFSFLKKRHFPYYKQAKYFLEKKGFKTIFFPLPPRFWTKIGLKLDYILPSIDIFHGMEDRIYPIKKAKKVVTIHDVRCLEFNESLSKEYLSILSSSPFSKQYLKDYFFRLNFFKVARRNFYKLAPQVDAIITVSQFSKEKIKKYLKIDENKIYVIYHGISKIFKKRISGHLYKKILQKYNIKFPYLLFVGRIDPLKNLISLIRAFKKIKEEFFLYKLVIVGKITWFYEVLKKEVEKLKLQKDIIFTNHVDDQDLVCFYQNADVFVFPSLYEGFGIPVLEAMACGTPVVASNVCSLPEIVKDNGILVDPYDVEDIADGIYKILKDDNLRHDLIKKGLSYIEEFTWEKAAKKHIEVYKKLS